MQGKQPSKFAYSKCQEEGHILDPHHATCFPLDCRDALPTTHILVCMLLLYQHQPFPPNLAGAAFVRPFTHSVSEMWEMEALPSSALWDLPFGAPIAHLSGR